MNLYHYKKNPLYIIFVLVIFIGIVLLFTFQDWINRMSSDLIDNRWKMIIFVLSSLIGPSLLYVVFQRLDESWWKYKWTNFLIEIPDLNGWYFGEVESIIRGEGNKNINKLCSIEIVQTASNVTISMYLFEKDQNHHSTCENINTILICELSSTKLYHIYRNDKDLRKALTSPPSSIGTCEFRVAHNSDGKLELQGAYYNQRGNTGIINATFVDNTIIGKFRQP